jgi:hypothetical protein
MTVRALDHDVKTVRTSRGRRRTTFYAICACGRSTTSSASNASAREKIRRHVAGDDSGMHDPREGVAA